MRQKLRLEISLPLVVLAAFLLCFLIQLYYPLFVHIKLRNYKIEDKKAVQHPVSVIICARNEEENLRNNLPLILEQDYSDFEVIVVNDCSSDESEWVLKEYSEKYSRLRIVTLKEHDRFKHGKKFAVTLGIKAAKNEYLLFTDADCRPATQNWLNRMQRHFSQETEIVLGYSPYYKTGGFVNTLIRTETFFTAVNYLSYALKGNPYMGVGRNLAYKKSLFFRSKGFASHMHIPSGDDDLFVNQNAAQRNTAIEIHPDAQVWSEPKKTFASYSKQKLRHFGAGKAYKKEHQRMLSLQAGSAIVFYILAAILLGMKAFLWIVLSAYLLRLIVQLIVYYPVFKKLNSRDLVFSITAFDLIYYFYILAINLIRLFNKKVQWK